MNRQVVAKNSKGQEAHKYEVKPVATPKGFAWWVQALHWANHTRRVDPDTGKVEIRVSGKPTRWNCAGPFNTREEANAKIGVKP